jgi:F-type H+-transporting ATPase subunit gamma
MVSAAKLKRAQDSVTQMRPYANKLKEIIQNVSSNSEGDQGIYSTVRSGKNILIIPISSNRGLAGAFNSNIIKRVNSLLKNELADSTVTLLPVGKKVNDAFRKTKYVVGGSDIPHNANHLFDKLTFENAAPIIEQVMAAYKNFQFDKVILIYNQFKNAAVQITTEEQMLPIVQSGDANAKSNYIFEPSEDQILETLIPLSLKTQFYKALLDSVASEHGARMTAMHKATDNAMAMQKELKITYNKARQASITKEILEIVGGAEALKN